MPWVNPYDENDMTGDEFDEFTDNCIEDDEPERMRSRHVWVSPSELFDHSPDEIMELERRNIEDGEYLYKYDMILFNGPFYK